MNRCREPCKVNRILVKSLNILTNSFADIKKSFTFA